MDSKLQHLTEKLYKDGVSKGNLEAEKIISDAKRKADETLAQAKKQAAGIIEEAGRKSEELSKNTLSELRIACRQAINTLKQDIGGLILAKAVDEPVEKAFDEKDFVNKLIETLASNWSPGQENSGFDIFLSEDKIKEVEEYFNKRAKESLKKGMSLKTRESLAKGFEIGPAEGGFKISVTDKDVEAYLKEFLRPRKIGRAHV